MINLAHSPARPSRLGRLAIVLIGFLMLLAPVVLADGPGDLDPTFGDDGLVTTTIGLYSRGYAVAIQTDGKILVAGDARSESGFDFALARYTSAGQLDPTFGVGGIVTTTIEGVASVIAMTVQPDGKIVVAGRSSAFGHFEDFALARYTPAGQLDPSFSDNGIVTTTIGSDTTPLDIALQPDGKIVVVGYSRHGWDIFDFTLARYTSSGQLDLSFDDDGVVTTTIDSSAAARSVTLQPDGKIVVAGSSSRSGGIVDFALARYTLAGQLDPGFSQDGIVTTTIDNSSWGYGVALQPDGKIVVTGMSSRDNFALARYTPAGQLDPSFSDDGIVTTTIRTNGVGYAVALQPDGKIVVAGTTNVDFALARYTPAGQLDLSFSNDGIVSSTIGVEDWGHSDLALQLDGKIIVAGKSNHPSNISGDIYSFAVARYYGQAPSQQLTIVNDLVDEDNLQLACDFSGALPNFTLTANSPKLTASLCDDLAARPLSGGF